jgi:hypothetical protein
MINFLAGIGILAIYAFIFIGIPFIILKRDMKRPPEKGFFRDLFK